VEAPLLDIRNLDASYADLQVLRDVSLCVPDQEIVALLGTNGAGKSTLLRCITGLHSPSKGSIFFNGTDITHIAAHRRVKTGIILVPEERGIFPDLSVEENLKVGGYSLSLKSVLRDSFAWIYDLFPILKDRRTQIAGSLSGGEQQMLSIAKGLISRPKLLVIDELSLGLAPVIIFKLLDLLEKIHRQGVTILLVDQNIQRVLSISDRAYVIENGRIALRGSGEDLLHDPRTKKVLLGR